MEQDFKRRFFVSLLITIPILVLSPTIQDWFNFTVPRFTGYNYVLFGLATIIAFYGGWPFYKGAKRDLERGVLGMMVLVSIAVGTGYLFSAAATFILTNVVDFYWEISTLVVFLLFGHWMEMRMTRRASGALEELVKLIPPTANRIEGDEIVEVSTDYVEVGDVLLVRPGEKVPIDGVIIEGRSALDESMITGESKPVAKGEGDEVIGGTINTTGALRIKIEKTSEETALAQIIQLMEEVQESKPPTQKLADRAAHYLTITAITVGLGSFIYWNYFGRASLVFALTTMVTVTVIACPHALGLAIPTVTAISTTLAASNGILVKNADALEVGEKIDTIIFDKTGTLTKGTFSVTDIISSGDMSEEELLRYAASLEYESEHPIGKASNEAAKEREIELHDTKGFEAISGHGVRGTVNDRKMTAGTLKLMNDMGKSISEELLEKGERLYDEAKTLSYIAIEDEVVGIVAFLDELKDSSLKAIEELHALGKEIIMITGDNERTARAIAEKAGIDDYLAEVLPEDKASEVKKIQDAGKKVAMVGDGINDAPALVQADVGIAIGAGTDVAIESADIVLIKNEPSDVLKLIRLSKATMQKMRENLFWASGYNAIAIPVAAGVLMPWNITLRPEVGALIMSASSIIVVANALLLRNEEID
ncbi:heavy metal translocating P-type ATPase [Candidatus Bathyarchaeota archaeon]|nr:heavy metal translocating P-type ATPase [Candidatus Bathyarchaeota archaeon]